MQYSTDIDREQEVSNEEVRQRTDFGEQRILPDIGAYSSAVRVRGREGGTRKPSTEPFREEVQQSMGY